MENNNERTVEKKWYAKLALSALTFIMSQFVLTSAALLAIGIVIGVLGLDDSIMNPESPWGFAALGTVTTIANVISFFITKAIMKMPFKEITKHNDFKTDLSYSVKYTGIFIGFLALEDFITNFLNWLTKPLGISIISGGIGCDLGNPMNIVMLFLLTCVGAPILEELVFRGIIMRSALKKTNNPKFAIMISAILFGLMHTNGVVSLVLIVVGMYLGYLCYKTDSIVPNMILHCVNNFVVLIQMILTQYVENAGLYIIILDIVMLLCSVVMIAKNKKNYQKLAPIEKGSIKKTMVSVPGIIFMIFVIMGVFTSITKI